MLVGAHPGRSADDELTVFKSLGLAVEDLAAADLCVAGRASRASGPRSTSDPTRRDRAARETIADVAVRTPLVRLHGPDVRRNRDLAQARDACSRSARSRFAVRLNAVRQAPAEAVAEGVATTSAGNMAQGVAWTARVQGVPATIVVPDNAAATKLAAVERSAAPSSASAQSAGGRHAGGPRGGRRGYFVHPVRDDAVMAGNGTIGLELVEQLDAFDSVIVPWGGGGLFTGIASALKQLRPDTRVYAVQPATASALVASVAAGATGRHGERKVVRRRSRLRARSSRRCGSVREPLVRARSPSPSTDTRPRYACSPSVSVSSPKAPARSALAAALAAAPARPDRLHRLGRQHRLARAGRDPRRQDSPSLTAFRGRTPPSADAIRIVEHAAAMRPLFLRSARLIAIRAQGYAAGRAAARPREVEAAVRRLSCVQLDSISAVERSHRIAIARASARTLATQSPAARARPPLRVLGARGVPPPGGGLAALRASDAERRPPLVRRSAAHAPAPAEEILAAIRERGPLGSRALRRLGRGRDVELEAGEGRCSSGSGTTVSS